MRRYDDTAMNNGLKGDRPHTRPGTGTGTVSDCVCVCINFVLLCPPAIWINKHSHFDSIDSLRPDGHGFRQIFPRICAHKHTHTGKWNLFQHLHSLHDLIASIPTLKACAVHRIRYTYSNATGKQHTTQHTTPQHTHTLRTLFVYIDYYLMCVSPHRALRTDQ